MNGSTTRACPSELGLDDLEVHGGDGELARHVQNCGDCQRRLSERGAERAAFEEGAGALWTRIAAESRERQGRRRRRRWTLFGLLAPGAAAGVLALWLATAPPAAPYLAPKGAPLEILCRRGNQVFVLAPGDLVVPEDDLVFRPMPVWPEARFIQIGSVDGTARYTSFYPSTPGAPSAPLPAAGSRLEGAIRLDAAPGPERLFVVLSPAPVSEAAVRAIAERSWRAAATVEQIDGVAVRSGWIVLPKNAGGTSAGGTSAGGATAGGMRAP